MNPVRISYAFFVLTIILVAPLNLATPLLTVLFSCFALKLFTFGGRKWLAVVLFSVAVLAASYGLAFFVQRSLEVLPKVAATTIPTVIEFAKKYDVELPFADWDGLREMTLEGVMLKVKELGTFAKGAGRHMAQAIIGVVVAVSLFLNARMVLEDLGNRRHLYAAICDEIAARFRSFFESFSVVMGAQIVISAINTALTSIFIFAVDLPHAWVWWWPRSCAGCCRSSAT